MRLRSSLTLLIGFTLAWCSSPDTGEASPSGGGDEGGDDGGTTPPDTVAETPSTHFDATPKQWAVPARGVQNGFSTVSASYWATVDLDGDGKPELVYTRESDSNGVWGGDGSAYWKVFSNTGSGFAKDASKWVVPARGSQSGFDKTSAEHWTLLDLDGDDKPDLVYTDETDSNGVWGGDGSAYWQVFLNTGSGFAKTASKWTVPARGSQRGFNTTAGRHWATIDIDGDGKPELVYTDEDGSNGVWGGDGSAYWKVFSNTGSGFAAAPLAWIVPARGAQSGFGSTSTDHWATMDIDGNGKPDLVYTNETDSDGVWGGDGDAHWKVFSNTGSGFAKTASKWAVPARGSQGGFNTVIGTHWATMDIDGNGKPDLVYTDEADSSGVWVGDGDAYWKVFANTGSGFAAAPANWSVPARGARGGFNTLTGPHWTTMDIDGDKRPDLVYTDESDSNTVWGGDGAAYWKAFLGTP